MRTCLILLLTLGAPLAAVGQSWPRWRGPEANGTWPRPRLAENWPAEGLQRRWQQAVGPAFSGISVAGGRVYTMDRPAGTTDERVLCLDAATGDVLWQFRYAAPYGDLDYDKGPRSTPTVHQGCVYTLGADGHLHCLRADDGQLVWKADLVRNHQAVRPTWGFAASPVVHEDQLVVHAGMQPGGCYAAFDLDSGQLRWQGGEDPAGYATPILIRHGPRRLLVGWTPHHVVGMSPDDGRVFWKIPYRVSMGVSIAAPVYHRNTIFVSGYWEGARAIRLGADPSTASLAWEENRYLRGLMAQPLVRDGFGYLLDKRHGVVCFDFETGRRVWTDENRLTPRGRNPQVTMVWVGSTDQAICLNSDGQLILVRLSPDGYAELARSKVVGPTWAHPAYAGNFVYARDDERLVCVELPADQ